MSILLLVVVLLVIAIVLSRLTWASQFGERRSIKHHEQAMDVLRSVSGRPPGSEDAEDTAHASAHIKSSMDDGARFPAPAGSGAVPEASVQREETIRILRGEGSGEPAASPTGQPVEPEPTEEPAAVEARQAGTAPPSWEPVRTPQGPYEGDREPSKPAFVFLADDSDSPGTFTLPPDIRAPVPSGDGGGGANGDGWADGDQEELEPAAAGPSTLPRPPSIGDADWAASSRSEARSRSRARTRSRVLGRVLAPIHATGRAASGARARLGPRRADAGVPGANGGSGVRPDVAVGGETATDGVRVLIADAPEAAAMPDTDTDATTLVPQEAGELVSAPGPEVPVPPPPGADRPPVPEGAAAFEAGPDAVPSAPRIRPRRRSGLVLGLAAVVVAVCVAVGVLVATMSTSSNKGQPVRQATPSVKPAPTPPPSPLKLVSGDQQGSVYNVNSGRLVVSAVASGRVWVEVVAGTGPSGSVLWQGILNDGQSQTVTNDAPVWVRVGAASNVKVSVNGGGVLLPTTPTTYNLTFSQSQL